MCRSYTKACSSDDGCERTYNITCQKSSPGINIYSMCLVFIPFLFPLLFSNLLFIYLLSNRCTEAWRMMLTGKVFFFQDLSNYYPILCVCGGKQLFQTWWFHMHTYLWKSSYSTSLLQYFICFLLFTIKIHKH